MPLQTCEGQPLRQPSRQPARPCWGTCSIGRAQTFRVSKGGVYAYLQGTVCAPSSDRPRKRFLPLGDQNPGKQILQVYGVLKSVSDAAFSVAIWYGKGYR